jgi:hypothetical protein
VGIVVVIIIVAAASGGGSKSTSTSSPSEPASGTAQPPSMPQSEKDARSWIKEHEQEARLVSANVAAVAVNVGLLAKSESEANINEVAKQAQEAHDRLDEVRNTLASGEYGGAVGNAALEIFSSANNLKNAMGALVAYTGNPNPATLAHFSTQYQPAVAEWNKGIEAMWHLGHKSGVPSI